MIKTDNDLFQQAIADLEKDGFNSLCTNFYVEIEKRNSFLKKINQMSNFRYLNFEVIYFENEFFLLKSFDLNFLNTPKITKKGANDSYTFTIKVQMDFNKLDNYSQFLTFFKKTIKNELLKLKSKFILSLNDSDEKLTNFFKYNLPRKKITMDVMSFSDFKRLKLKTNRLDLKLLLNYFKNSPKEYIAFVENGMSHLSWALNGIYNLDSKQIKDTFETVTKKIDSIQELISATRIIGLFRSNNEFVDADYMIHIINQFEFKMDNDDCNIYIKKILDYFLSETKFNDLYKVIVFINKNRLLSGPLSIEMLNSMPNNIAHKIFDSYSDWSLDRKKLPVNNKSIDLLLLLYKEFDLLNNSKIKVSLNTIKTDDLESRISPYVSYLGETITDQNYKYEYKNILYKINIIKIIYSKFF